MNQYQRAEPFLKEIKNSDIEENYDVHLDLIELYSKAQKYEKALAVCKRVLICEQIEDKSVIKLKMGLLYGFLGKKDKEIKAYRDALKLNPNNNNVRFKLSEIFESQGKLKEALEILSKP